MITYVVVEGEVNKKLLELVLPDTLKQHIIIAPTGNPYEAKALGSSMLMTRRNPVVLVIDALTEDAKRIAGHRAYLYQFLGSNLAWADAVYEVFMAVPSLEVALLNTSDTKVENLSAMLTPDVVAMARQHPLIVELSQFIAQNITETQPS